MGRPAIQLMDKDLKEIEILAGMGLTQEQAASTKGISVDTLRKYASEEWQRGKAKGLGKVAQAAFNMASSGKYPSMTRFFLQTQGGDAWRTTPTVPAELLTILQQMMVGSGGNDDDT